MEIVELAHCPHVGPLLARWHVEEWAPLYPGWDVATATAEFAAMDRPGRVPTTWVACSGAECRPEDVLGSVSLIDDDELPGWREVGPWLASLFVVPAARGQGLGELLVRHVVEAARGLGIERLHLFTAGQEDWYAARGWRTIDRPDAHGTPTAVMVFDTLPRAPRRATTSRWVGDPYVGGAYSYLRVGGTSADRDRLAEPVHPGLFLAGEATSAPYPGTAHGAWLSGERAASLAQHHRPGGGRAVVVGAGLAGLGAATALKPAGGGAGPSWKVTVLEAGPEPGGRIRVDRTLGGPLPLGAMWAHGTEGNPFLALAEAAGVTPVAHVFRSPGTFVAGAGLLGEPDTQRLRARFAELEATLFDIPPGAADEAVGPTIRALLDTVTDAQDRAVLACWFRGEFENLYAAPVDDLSRKNPAEPFRLPGDDVMLVGDLGDAVARVADGLDLRTGTAVTAIRRTVGDTWTVTTASGERFEADCVVVTAAVPTLQRGTIAFDPPLPDEVRAAVGRIGAGPVAKTFFTFDEAWWAPLRSFWVAAPERLPLELWVDVSPFLGHPTLCAFACGDAARRVEQASEDDLCQVALDVLRLTLPR